VFQLACELLLLSDLSSLQAEAVGALIGLVVTFGLDGMAIIGFFLCCRAK